MEALYLSTLTWQDADALLARDDRLIFVTGATEQHGLHLPLATDTLIPTALAERLSAASGVPIAPALPFGMSEGHMAFAGTFTLSQEVLQGLYLDLIKSAYRHGWRRLFWINGHGGNRAALTWAVSLACKLKRDLKVYVSHWWTEESARAIVREAYGRNEGHAGLEESVAVLASRPDLVHLERAAATPDIEGEIWSLDPQALRAASPSGAVGENPAQATAEVGERIMARLAREYADLLNGDWT